MLEGAWEGRSVGLLEGARDGASEKISVGPSVIGCGAADGEFVVSIVGILVGAVGSIVGVSVVATKTPISPLAHPTQHSVQHSHSISSQSATIRWKNSVDDGHGTLPNNSLRWTVKDVRLDSCPISTGIVDVS